MSELDLPSVLQPTTLDPLTDELRHGLIPVAFFGLFSLLSTTGLFAYLTYRGVVWHHKGQLKDGTNQFVVLIYNLLLADIQQALSFAFSAVYLANDKIEVGTGTCWANGWFNSVGDLASGGFILFIALHTFFAVVKGRRMNNKTFYSCIAGLWIFVFLLPLIAVGRNPHVYVRAGAWCWIDHRYEAERLWLHYFWIFICIFGTIVVYTTIFISIQTKFRLRSYRNSIAGEGVDPAILKRAAKYMIIYPVVYVICTLPLAGARMASMTGMIIPYWWYCLAGSAMTSCGWLDVLLYSITRRVLVFSDRPPLPDDLGLDTFGWNAPGVGDGYWGTITTITGPTSEDKPRGRKRGWFGQISSTPTLRHRNSDEDYFAGRMEGAITTKTTIEISSGNVHHDAGSEHSLSEMDVKEHRNKDQGRV